jgi:hypothetical protein
MADSPEVYEVCVHAADLKGETPVAARDTLERYELAIDFSWPPEAITASLQAIFQDAVGSQRWSRNDTREQAEADPQTEDSLT